MAKKVEQLPAQPSPSGSALIVISEAGVSKKSTIDEILAGVRSEIDTDLSGKLDANPLITAKTATKITYDANGLVTGGTSATTGDINDITDRRYVTDAQLLSLAEMETLIDSDGNLVLATPGAGIILTSPSGDEFHLNVNDEGSFVDMSGFVTVRDGKYWLKGAEYRGVGFNFFDLAWSSKSDITTIMDYTLGVGGNELRFWLYDSGKPPTDSAGNFRFLDYEADYDNNLFTNFDFETDTADWTLQSGWTRSSDYAYENGFSIKGVNTSGFNGMLSDPITVTDNTDYVLTFYYKQAEHLSGNRPIVSIRESNGTTEIKNGGSLANTPANTSGGWERKQVSFNSGVNTEITVKVLNNNGSVTFYYDYFCLNVQGAPFLSPRESQFELLDFVFDEARKRGLKLRPSFADNTTNYNTKQTYVNWANSIYGAGLSTASPYIGFFTSVYTKQIYKDFLSLVLNRKNTINGVIYKEDTTVKNWELGNELRLDRNDPSGINSINSANIALLSGPNGWADEMSTYIVETLGAKQLVSFGSMSHEYEYKVGDTIYNGSYYGVSAKILAQRQHIHILDFHLYPTQDAQQTELYGALERDIVSYGQKVANKPAPIKQTGTAVTSKVITLNAPSVVDDEFVVHLVFSSTPGSTPTVTDSAGNTYNLDSITNSNTRYHYSGPQVAGGATTITATWTGSRNITAYVDEISGRENANNARSREGLEAQLLDWIELGKQYGKPADITETGLSNDINDRNNYHYPLQPRLDYFDALFTFWFENGGASIDIWSAFTTGGSSYSINLGDKNGEAVTDNSNDTNLNKLITSWNVKLMHDIPKSQMVRDIRYAESELSPRTFDGDYQGITQQGTAGQVLAFGDLIYLDDSDSRWRLADANLGETYDKKLGICLIEADGNGESIKVLIFGTIRADSVFPTFTPGKPVFMSETAGDVSNSKPTTTGAAHRIVGFADTTDQLSFQPDGHFTYVS